MDIANNRAEWNAGGTLERAWLRANCLREPRGRVMGRRAACMKWRTASRWGVAQLRQTGATADKIRNAAGVRSVPLRHFFPSRAACFFPGKDQASDKSKSLQ